MFQNLITEILPTNKVINNIETMILDKNERFKIISYVSIKSFEWT